MSTATASPANDDLRLTKAAPKAYRAAGWLVMIGLLASALSLFVSTHEFWGAYLVAFMFVTSITLGGLFFVILQHLVRAGWSVTVRRAAEGIAYNVRFLPFLFLPLVYAISQGYLQPEAALHHGGAHHGPQLANVIHHPIGVSGTAFMEGMIGHAPFDKAQWLSFGGVMGRMALYFLLWFGIARFYFKSSVAQDATGDVALTNRMQRWAPPCMIAFALSTTFCAFDMLMALAPHWYSTIFGVYFFSGCLISFFATLTLFLVFCQGEGLLQTTVTAEHYQDIGKFMFAFIVFWAYIAYSQYMLIWYGNIPEETAWFFVRQSGDWIYVSVFQIVGHFVIPFFVLLSRWPKRHPRLLALGAIYVLLIHFVDLFWIIQPQLSPLAEPPVPLLHAFLSLAFVGFYIAWTVTNLRRVDLIPVRDPRLGEALTFENF